MRPLISCVCLSACPRSKRLELSTPKLVHILKVPVFRGELPGPDGAWLFVVYVLRHASQLSAYKSRDYHAYIRPHSTTPTPTSSQTRPTRLHLREDPRQEIAHVGLKRCRRVGRIGVGVGVVECGLYQTPTIHGLLVVQKRNYSQ